MKRVMYWVLLVILFMGVPVTVSLADPGHEAHQPGDMREMMAGDMPHMMGGGMHEMMGARMHGMMDADKHRKMSCDGHCKMGGGMYDKMGHGKHDMMGGRQMGMMAQRMEHMFYLDQAKELGLSAEQVGKLKTIHSECRKDNIRNAAEKRISRLELTELMDGESWTLKNAEPLIRKIQQLEGDIQIRRLQAMSAANKVLTPEQLKQARTGDNADDPESLFD